MGNIMYECKYQGTFYSHKAEADYKIREQAIHYHSSFYTD